MELLPGHKFRPSKKLLIEYYLIKKIKGEAIPRNPVKDCDVYGDPRIWRKHFEQTEMKTHYFYTPLKNRKRGTKMQRTTEFGTWDNNKKYPIYDDDDDDDDDDEEKHDDFNKRERKHIGLKTTFSLKNAYDHNANWRMHEYKLDGIYKNMPNEDEYALCQINKIKKQTRGTEDNSQQNIQDEGEQPLDVDKLMDGAFQSSDWIDQYSAIQVTYSSTERMELPPGYIFCPSKKQLIEYYLIKKIKGEAIPGNPVKDCDVYGDPRIWRKHFEQTEMKTHYFYTPLKNRKRGTKMQRTTEFGTWDNKNRPSKIYDDGDEEEHDDFNKRERKHVGRKTAFSLKNAFDLNANWTMHEYKLDGIYKNMPNEVDLLSRLAASTQTKDECVLCQINKNIKKRRVTKDNPHQNIQDKGAQPLELMGSAFENSDRIGSSHQNIQDEGTQPLDKDVRGETGSNGQSHGATKDNSHQNVQDEGAQDIDVMGYMDTCPPPNVYSNWPQDISYSQDTPMDSPIWSVSLWTT